MSVALAVGTSGCGTPPAPPDVGGDMGVDGGAPDVGPPDCPPSCDDGIGCTVDACDEATGRCVHTADSSICDDGSICTGTETCDADIGCLPGLTLVCSDGDDCTIDECDRVLGCRFVPLDRDGDGFPSDECLLGLDCDDNNPNINPAVVESCIDGIDNNCNGVIDEGDLEPCPTGDTCGDALALMEGETFGFATFGLEDDYALACESGSNNPDIVFRFTTTEELDFAILVSGPVNTAVELRPLGACDDDTRGLACDRITSSFGVEALGARIERTSRDGGALPAGTYDVVVSTPAEDFYSITLMTPEVVPPDPDDECAPPTPVLEGTTTIEGDFTAVTDVYPGLVCGKVAADAHVPDFVRAFRLGEASDITVEATGVGAFGFPRDVRYAVVRVCEDPNETALDCAAGGDVLRLTDVPAGEYWLVFEPDDFVEAETFTADVAITPGAP